MSWFMIDVEANGQCPGLYSMTEFACVLWDTKTDHPVRFHGKMAFKDGDKEDPEAIRVIGDDSDRVRVSEKTDKELRIWSSPRIVMQEFVRWVNEVNEKGRPMFISDNNGFDYQFINYYCHKYVGVNPFGHSSTNLGSLYKGYVRDVFKSFKKLRKTAHTHHPVDDCLGNIEAMDTLGGIGGFGPGIGHGKKAPREDQA